MTSTNDLRTRLLRMATCIYIAVEEEVADDISDGLTKAVAALDERDARIKALEDHIGEQITHVETRIQDGREMGASVWRIALEDVARENRNLLTNPTPKE